MIATSAQRVSNQTRPSAADSIQQRMEMRVVYFAAHPDQIDQRLDELDREWDIERMLETGSSAISLTGLLLTILRGRKWLVLPLVVQGFFMQHALQGWCPPLPLLRRLGFRTQYEIEQERYALKALRGDFKDIEPPGDNAAKALEAAQS